MPRFSFKNIVQLTKKQLDKKKVEANRQLQNNNNALKDSINHLNDGYQESKLKIETIADEVKIAVRKKKNLNDSINKLTIQHETAKNTYLVKKSKLDDISQQLAKLTKDAETGKKSLETINRAVKQTNAIKPDIIKYKEELKSVSQDLLKKKLDLEDMINQKSILKDSIKNISDEYEKKIKPYKTKLVKVKEDHDSLCKGYKVEIDKLEGEVQDIVSVVTKHKGQLKSIEREIAAAKSIFEDNAEKIKNATDEYKQLEREKDVLMRDIADAKRNYDEWTIKALEKVAKMQLKNKIDVIDKAGLKDLLNAV